MGRDQAATVGRKVAGRKKVRVMASGVFDLMHPGHIYYLEQAKALGDELIVVVANDAVVARTKGQPLFDAAARQRLVAALAVVDRAIVPTETDRRRFYRTVLAIAPDIIALGYDQTFTEQELAAELAAYGWQGRVVRIGPEPGGELSSTLVKSKVRGANDESV